jgi:hypothetical protein
MMKRIVLIILGCAALSAITPAIAQVTPAASSVGSDNSQENNQSLKDVSIKDPTPSEDVILAWWKKRSDASIDVSDIEPIGLKNHELAYLASATFNDAGRNGMFGAVLIRPKLEEVIDVSEYVGNEYEVYDLDNDGISEVVSKVSGSGQGTEMGKKLIVMFDEWKPIVLHEVAFMTGMSMDSTSGRDETIDWKFVNKSDVNKYAKLIEAIYINEWTAKDINDEHRKENITRENNIYNFINKKFEKEKVPNTASKTR